MSTSEKNIIIALRIAMGSLFLYAGISKALSDFSAQMYLQNATSGLFAELFIAMAGNPIVDILVVFGEIGIGISLLFGIFLRFGCYSGMLMMFLFYLSNLPPENGLISMHVIYFLCFALLGIFKAGTIFGLDSYLEESKFVKDNTVLKYLLG